MGMTEMPKAVWSGTIMGIGVHVLDDGRRIIDAAGFETLLERLLEEKDDAALNAAAAAFASFAAGGPLPPGGSES